MSISASQFVLRDNYFFLRSYCVFIYIIPHKYSNHGQVVLFTNDPVTASCILYYPDGRRESKSTGEVLQDIQNTRCAMLHPIAKLRWLVRKSNAGTD